MPGSNAPDPRNLVRRVGDWAGRVAGSMTRWATIGHRDMPCPKCGTIVRAGMRECVLCGNQFEI